MSKKSISLFEATLVLVILLAIMGTGVIISQLSP